MLLLLLPCHPDPERAPKLRALRVLFLCKLRREGELYGDLLDYFYVEAFQGGYSTWVIG